MTTMIETREKRTVFGKIVKCLFVAFNLFMAWWFCSTTWTVAQQIAQYHTDAERTGAGLGLTADWMILLFIWFLGGAVLGAFLMLTRGRKIFKTCP